MSNYYHQSEIPQLPKFENCILFLCTVNRLDYIVLPHGGFIFIDNVVHSKAVMGVIPDVLGTLFPYVNVYHLCSQ